MCELITAKCGGRVVVAGYFNARSLAWDDANNSKGLALSRLARVNRWQTQAPSGKTFVGQQS